MSEQARVYSGMVFLGSSTYTEHGKWVSYEDYLRLKRIVEQKSEQISRLQDGIQRLKEGTPEHRRARDGLTESGDLDD